MAAARIFAACAPGLEPTLAAELAGLGLEARATPGGADAAGEDAVALACVGSRVADAVAVRLWSGPASGLQPALRSAREAVSPGTELAVRRAGGLATVSVDAVGSPLFRRGWRARVGAAPLRESIAAGLLLAAGYDGSEPLLDPMCGSGTIAIEAAEIAARRAPGRGRSFAFEGWPGHDPARLADVRRRLAARERRPPCPIHASDRNAGALRLAGKNAASAGVDGLVRLERRDAADAAAPPGRGLLATNPPYGVRLAEDPAASWRALDVLLRRLIGWRAAVLAPDRGIERYLTAPCERLASVRNGGIRCQLLLLRP